MLDIEIIQKDRVQLRKVILYEYSTATFKPHVFKKIRDSLDEKGIQFRQIDYDNVMYSFNELSLFGEYLVLIDLDELAKDKQHKEYLVEMANLIEVKAINNRYLIIIRKSSSRYEVLKRLQSVLTLAKSATRIKEPDLTKQTFARLFDYICSRYTSLIDLTQLENFTMFKTSLEDYVIREKLDLSEFVSQFDIFVFVAIDFKTNQFDPQVFRTLVSTREHVDTKVLHRLIFDFIITPSKGTASKLFINIDECINQDSVPVKKLISIFFRITRDFNRVNSKLNLQKRLPEGMSNYIWKQLMNFESIPLEKLFRWQILLAKYEAKLNTRNFLLTFQEFLEEFTGIFYIHT